MQAGASKIDHPLLAVGATVAAALLMLAVTIRIEPAAAAMGAGALLTLWVFVCGGLLFALYAPAAARWSGAIPPHDCILLGAFGVSFAGWGFLAAAFAGGFFGVLHALVCTAALGALVRDWRVVIAPVLALAPAWAVVFRLSEGPGALPISQTVWMLIPVLVWNVEMSLVLAAWSAWRRRHPLPSREPGRRRQCPICRYDLTGLWEPICPECGADVTLPGSEPRRCPLCRYDLTGLGEPICPECGADVDLPASPRAQRSMRAGESGAPRAER
jgi:hypothetical protein